MSHAFRFPEILIDWERFEVLRDYVQNKADLALLCSVFEAEDRYWRIVKLLDSISDGSSEFPGSNAGPADEAYTPSWGGKFGFGASSTPDDDNHPAAEDLADWQESIEERIQDRKQAYADFIWRCFRAAYRMSRKEVSATECDVPSIVVFGAHKYLRHLRDGIIVGRMWNDEAINAVVDRIGEPEPSKLPE